MIANLENGSIVDTGPIDPRLVSLTSVCKQAHNLRDDKKFRVHNITSSTESDQIPLYTDSRSRITNTTPDRELLIFPNRKISNQTKCGSFQP